MCVFLNSMKPCWNSRKLTKISLSPAKINYLRAACSFLIIFLKFFHPKILSSYFPICIFFRCLWLERRVKKKNWESNSLFWARKTTFWKQSAPNSSFSDVRKRFLAWVIFSCGSGLFECFMELQKNFAQNASFWNWTYLDLFNVILFFSKLTVANWWRVHFSNQFSTNFNGSGFGDIFFQIQVVDFFQILFV